MTTSVLCLVRMSAFVACAAMVACQPQVTGSPVPSSHMIVCGPAECRTGADVEISYLGVGGAMIKSGDHVLLTAPMFTNPTAKQVYGSLFHAASIRPDPDLIRQFFPKAGERASAILIGHGHYDHLLDIPFIADSLATGATIYGSQTVRNILFADTPLRRRVHPITGDSVGSVEKAGTWITTSDGAFRIMALRSSHAPMWKFLWWRKDWAPGNVDTTFKAFPTDASEWQAGETYAYLIDVLDRDGKTAFRMYYQDAANDAPLGLPPKDLDGRRIDVALLCMPDAQFADPPGPDLLVQALRPRYVIADHWESFFVPRTQKLELNPVSDAKRFDRHMKRFLPADAEWSMPVPGTTYRFRAVDDR